VVKLHPESPLRRLTDNFPRVGRLEWIGLRREPRGAVVAVTEAEAIAERGLTGDHRSRRAGSARQVTLIQREHLDVLGMLLGRASVAPELLRRNLAISGVNVLALKDQVFRIGDVILEGTDPCEPCSRMEANLGEGGYNAMRGHGGITARILVGGVLRIGDVVRWIDADTAQSAANRLTAGPQNQPL
jgi:MOSC domain-containing protein YiiM